MAEKTILVCDACGKPAAETVTMKTSRGNFVKDLCSTHVNELVAGARKPRPGRRKGTTVAAAPKPAAKAAAATPKKRGRPRKNPAS
ncbi:MAG: hypothetical protein ACXWE5_03345 [Actinomycetota bacterium]